ncbi:MAG: TolB family protein, partial [Pseudomonadota bacterium]
MTRTQQQRQGQRVSLLARRPHSGRSFAFLAVIVAVFLLAGCGDLEDYANRPQRDIYRQKRQLPERTPYPSPALQVSEAKDGAEIPDNLYVGAAEDIFDLVFHPGGEAVLFSYCKAGAACALYSYALASKTLRTVFKQAGVSAKQATYSPDGEWIVFNAYLFTPGGGEPDKSSYQIAMVDKNGSGLRFLTNYDYGINMLYGPNFSPDGRFVIFVRNLDPYPPPIPLEINRVSIATGNLERLALVKAGYPRAAAYNGNEQEIIFPVLIDWDEKNGEDRREVPCRDSRPVAESNA